MAEAVLAGIVFASAVFHLVSAWEWSREREHLIHLLVAKTPGEVKVLETSEARRDPAPPSPVIEGYEGQIGIS